MGVFLTSNNGTSWKKVNSSPTNIIVWSLAVCGSTIFAGTDKGVYLATDSGTGWTAANSGIADYRINCLAVSGSAVFAGTDSGGVSLTIDNGTSWKEVNSGLKNTVIHSLAVTSSTIFAGTGSGVWQRPLSEMIELTNVRPLREKQDQIQVKTDPFNRSGTKIIVEFTIRHSDHVAVAMYDFAGREVSSIVNQYHHAGAYRYVWNTRALARGCYTVRLQTGTTASSAAFVIVQ